jgi:hypothetical protein
VSCPTFHHDRSIRKILIHALCHGWVSLRQPASPVAALGSSMLVIMCLAEILQTKRDTTFTIQQTLATRLPLTLQPLPNSSKLTGLSDYPRRCGMTKFKREKSSDTEVTTLSSQGASCQVASHHHLRYDTSICRCKQITCHIARSPTRLYA